MCRKCFIGRPLNLSIMKILALADIHGKFFRLDGILKKSDPVDAVVIAGDLTHGGPPENAVRSISILEHFCDRVLCVPGNWDPAEVAQTMSHYAVNLDETPRIIGDWEFMGLGYSTPTGNATPSEVSEETMTYKLDVLLSHSPPKRTVLVTHQPPLETLDMGAKGPAGSKALRAALERVDVIICGHIHKARGKIKDGAWIINPGYAAEGQAAIVDLETMDVVWIDSVI